MEAVVELKDEALEGAAGGTVIDRDTGTYIWHRVTDSDDLYKIGRLYNCTERIIYSLNKSIIGSDPNQLPVSQYLKIPR